MTSRMATSNEQVDKPMRLLLAGLTPNPNPLFPLFQYHSYTKQQNSLRMAAIHKAI